MRKCERHDVRKKRPIRRVRTCACTYTAKCRRIAPTTQLRTPRVDDWYCARGQTVSTHNANAWQAQRRDGRNMAAPTSC